MTKKKLKQYNQLELFLEYDSTTRKSKPFSITYPIKNVRPLFTRPVEVPYMGRKPERFDSIIYCF